MIKDFYLNFANGIFRHIAPPDRPYYQYYMDINLWRNKIFTELFLFLIAISLLVTVVFYFYFNGKKMPAIYGTRKHWFYFMIVNAVLNILAVYFYLRVNQLSVGFTNHAYCTMTANAIFGTLAFFIISIILKRGSVSAKTIPCRI